MPRALYGPIVSVAPGFGGMEDEPMETEGQSHLKVGQQLILVVVHCVLCVVCCVDFLGWL